MNLRSESIIGRKNGSKIKEDGNEKGVVKVRGRWSVNVKEENITERRRLGRKGGMCKDSLERGRREMETERGLH